VGGAIGANEDFPHDLATGAAGIVGEFDFTVYEFRDGFGAERIALDTGFYDNAVSFSAWWNRFLTDFA
jgi:hypothetical protein